MNKPTEPADLNSYREITHLGEQRHQESTPPSSSLKAPNSEIPTPILLSQANIQKRR